MKLPGKEKIFFRQSIHIYLRISRNLEDEICPKGVGAVTPKILFDFFKLFEGGYLNFSSEELSHSKCFFYGKCFVLDSPKTWFLVLEAFPFYLDSKPKYFSLGKISFENLLNGPMVFE